MKNVILIIALLFISLGMARAEDKESVYNDVVDKYASLENISLRFSLRNNPDITGSLIAERGNKYLMNLNGRRIISDGKSIWNYHRMNNNVIISDFDPSSTEMSIEKFFFSLLKRYQPQSLGTEKSGKFKIYILTLTSDEENDIGKIKLWVDTETKDLISIGFMLEDFFQIWDIGDLKINRNIDAKTFKFKSNANTEVIDLR